MVRFRFSRRATACLSTLLMACAGVACAAEPAADSVVRLPGSQSPAVVRLAEPDEPGSPLRVQGTVYAPDGTTPVAGVTLYIYQTDLTGLYGNLDGAPRLRAWLKTDARGHFEYRTVRPASYPNSRIAAHIHTQIWGAGYTPQWNRDLLFAEDPFLSAREKSESLAAGLFAWICAPKELDGIASCTHNLRLKPQGDRFEESIRHGLDSAAARATP